MRQTKAVLLGLLAVAVVILQFPGTVALSFGSVVLALFALAWADRRALGQLWMPRFWALTAGVAFLAGVLLARPTHDLGPVPVSLEGARLAAVVVLRALALFAVVTLGVSRITEARLVALASHVGLGALGSAGYRALALVPWFVAAGQIEWSAARGRRRMARLGEAAVALLVRATRVAEGEPGPGVLAPAGIGELCRGKEKTCEQGLSSREVGRPVSEVEAP